MARAYSALASHRRLTRYNKDVRVSAALTVCRVQSILLGVIVALATNLTILFYQLVLLNEVTYFASTIGAELFIWKSVLKPQMQ